MLTIYNINGGIRANVQPSETSSQTCELMGSDVVNIDFTTPVPISFAVGDYINVFDKKYILNTPPTSLKEGDRNYDYKMVFESETQNLGKVLFLFLDRYNRFTDPEFSFTGTAFEFLTLLIKNLERVYPDFGYKIGLVVETAIKTISFSGSNCLEVINELATQFETEWLIEGNKISLYKKATNSGITLACGKGRGLYAITSAPQTNANPITRVYGYGSTLNLGSDYRLGAKRLRMADKTYLEKNTAAYGIVEIVKFFDDIYPRRTGSVTSVTSPLIFTDATIDFNVNDYLIAGVTAKVKFNTGQLAGYTFEIAGYNHATKTFTINKNTDEPNLDMPSDLFTPAIGDNYFLTDILMPNQYIANAEEELKQAVGDYLNKVAGDVPKVLTVVTDPIYFKGFGNRVQLGQLLTINEPMMGINITTRIVKYTRNLRRPSIYSIDLADAVKDNVLVKIVNA